MKTAILALALALTLLPSAGAAEGPRCTCSQPEWNAPGGAVVTYHANGLISPIMDALGEWRTHIMLSHGNGWVTHSTGNQDDLRIVDDTLCSRPIDPIGLEQMSPGLEQINLGGAAAYLTGVSDIRYVMSEDPGWPDYEEAEAAASWLWGQAPYQWDANRGLYLLGFLGSAGQFVPYTYGVTQYMSGVARLEGQDTETTGMVCSQVPAYGLAKFHDPDWSAQTLGYHRYGHEQTINAGINLWWGVYNGCMGQTSGIWGTIQSWLAPIIKGCSVEHACNQAAWQVLNCFASDPANGSGCADTSSSTWNNVLVNDPNFAAESLSPDGLTSFANPPDRAREGRTQIASPWATAPEQSLQWSGEAMVCGCWD